MISTHNRIHRYCSSDISEIEGYDEAINSDEMYELHHRLELTINGEFALGRKDLERFGMYWNRPPFELIFLKRDEHRRIHSTGRRWTDSTRKKQMKHYEDFRANITDEEIANRCHTSKWRWRKIQEMGYDNFVNSRKHRK